MALRRADWANLLLDAPPLLLIDRKKSFRERD